MTEEPSVFTPADVASDNGTQHENRQTSERVESGQDSAETQLQTPGQEAGVPSGTAPVANPHTEDSDDNRLIVLKTQGFTDAQVCEKLAAEGRVRCVPKTVAARYQRLKKVAEKREEERLDDELSDWHLGEDDHLEESLKIVEEKLAFEIQKLMDKKWIDVSEQMAKRLQTKKYTAKACEERWVALQDGTALKPIEIDSDKEGRKVMRETRIAAATQRRAEEREEAKRAQEAKDAAAREKKERKKQKYYEKVAAKEAREADKVETQRLRAEKKRGKDEQRALLKEAATLWKTQIEEKRKVRELEGRVYRNIAGKHLKRIRGYTAVDEDAADYSQQCSDNEDEEEQFNDADVEDGADEYP